MIRFNMNMEPACLLCNAQDQTLEHLFFKCPFSKLIMLAGPVSVPQNWSNDAEFWDSLIFDGIK